MITYDTTKRRRNAHRSTDIGADAHRAAFHGHERAFSATATSAGQSGVVRVQGATPDEVVGLA